jgi:two-component system nitrogen regulation sensor histidine kinase GlnL|tara:strand:- start:1367 stop:2431 length:1065 start_codon:yes stop_codon:yes gene_type:complete
MFKQILSELRTPVILINRNNIIEYINSTGEEFFEYSSSLLIGKSIETIIQKDSPLFILFSRVRKFKSGLTEDSFDFDTYNFVKRKVRVHIVPFYDDLNKIIIQIDQLSISENNKFNKNNNKISKSFSSLIDVLVHELRNPLAGIKGASQLLESDLKNDPKLIQLTQLIKIESDRIISLLRRMEYISNDKLQLRLEFLNIHKTLNHCIKIAENSFGSKVKIIPLYDPSLPYFYSDNDLLIQIFLNLIRNACEACNENGVIKIKTSFISNKRSSFILDGIPIKLPLQIEFIDNGQGIKEDFLPNIFDPFISTKKSGKGLGLSIVASGLNDIGAVIDVMSSNGITNFCLNFPLKKNE